MRTRIVLLINAPLVAVFTFGFSASHMRSAAATEADTHVPFHDVRPEIVNGVSTANYPSVGVLLGFDDQGQLIETCTGTLIGCETFLTAAHCVCLNGARNAGDCLNGGIPNPDRLEVFFQHLGRIGVRSLAIDPAFQFGTAGDVALVKLAKSINGIGPARINTTGKPPAGSRTTVVGFGESPGPGAAGIKRSGTVSTVMCERNVPDDAHLCSLPEGNSNSCAGDAGAPLLIDGRDSLEVVGLDSGFIRVADKQICEPGDRLLSFYSDVFFNRTFITEQSGGDVNSSSCGNLTQVGTPGTSSNYFEDRLDNANPERRYSIDVPAGARALRIALNSSYDVGVHLYVKADAEATPTTYDCETGTFRACSIVGANGGSLRQRTWHILASHVSGAGLFQLTATTFSSVGCPGDCNGVGNVTTDNLLTLVNIALGNGITEACAAGNTNDDNEITVDEILKAVNSARNGCA